MDRKAHDARPPIERARDTATRFDRFVFIPGTYEAVGKPHRLRVHFDEDFGLTDVLEERTTSESATAEGLDGTMKSLSCTDEEVRWLHRTLGDLIARWDAPAAPEEPETEEAKAIVARDMAIFAATRGAAEKHEDHVWNEVTRDDCPFCRGEVT